MVLKKHENIQWIEFEIFAGHPLKHGSFLRHGGHSQSPYNSLNFSYSVGDEDQHVKMNEKLICDILGIPTLTRARLSHSDTIMLAPTSSLCDAVATKQPNLGLLITHADCQAAIFYDPKKHALANVHCGWRGNVQNIYAKTVAFMQSEFGSAPEDILVGISPSLGPHDAEFINYKTELPEHFHSLQIKPHHFDFWEISKRQLQEAGILPKHIEVAEISTFSSEDCFSYRREKVSGRHGTVAMLM